MLENIKVGSKTNQSKLAGAIATAIRNNGTTTVSCVGQFALLQAIKGLTLARRFLLEEKTEIFCSIDMEDAPKVETMSPIIVESEEDSTVPTEEAAPKKTDDPRVIIKFVVTSKKIED